MSGENVSGSFSFSERISIPWYHIISHYCAPASVSVVVGAGLLSLVAVAVVVVSSGGMIGVSVVLSSGADRGGGGGVCTGIGSGSEGNGSFTGT